EFDTFLRKLAQKNGVYILEGELISLEEGKTIQAVIKTKNGNLLKINSKYIIAADGVNSKLCSLAGIQKPESFWTVSFQMPLDKDNINDT
ncbi:MAG: FAD-dependent monooxygenase, partial [Proteobacteria bacterium]|nr:FAD-dependent monooxygenase [Pseudomonadota bacterium]